MSEFPHSVIAVIALALLAACGAPLPAPTQPPVLQTAVIPPTVVATVARPEPQPTETRAVPVTPTRASAPPQTGPRRPRGLYAVVDIDSNIGQQQKANASITSSELHAFFNGLYGSLLSNPAVSGLTIQIGWSSLNPNPPSSPQPHDWTYLDDAFSGVDLWNGQNPGQAPKTIQIQVFPGYFTPSWVLDQIPSCDGLFLSPPSNPSAACGKATFAGFREPRDDLTILPMPWNPVYKAAWKGFLLAFAARYDANAALVSIDIAGPTAASTEIIEPTDSRTPPQPQFGGLSANDMWLRLLAFAYPAKPAYQKSDQAFIDEWNAATDMFGEIFSNVTLVATPGAGLPNLSHTIEVPSTLKDYCPTPDMDCVAEATILAHFADPAIGGTNTKAMQSSGLNAKSTGVGNMSPKILSQSTARLTPASAQILGAFQFGTSVARVPVQEGCTSKFPPDRKGSSAGNIDPSTLPVTDIPKACLAPSITQADLARYKQFGDVPAKDLISPEQGFYNVLKVFFDGTPAAASFGGSIGAVPMNYLQIYAEDFEYAAAHAGAPALVVQTGGTGVMLTAQDLLNLASQKLLEIAEPRRAPA